MKILIFIPTLNEAGTISELLMLINKLHPTLDILVVDDNSNDGTLHELRQLKSRELPIKIVVRASKMGIGSAHLFAINYAFDNNYNLIITMDGDGAHDPKSIKKLLSFSQNNDLVIGSRYLQKNSLIEWNIFRKSLTHIIHLVTWKFLGLNYDNSSAFRCYNLIRLTKQSFAKIKSSGYDFFFESIFILTKNQRIKIAQVPIYLPARTYGNSKHNIKLALIAFKTLVRLFFARVISRK
jgi:dolichol-phosphate mannosyltransferase